MARPATEKSKTRNKTAAAARTFRGKIHEHLERLQAILARAEAMESAEALQLFELLEPEVYTLRKLLTPTQTTPRDIHLVTACFELLADQERRGEGSTWRGPAVLLFHQLTRYAAWSLFNPQFLLRPHSDQKGGSVRLFDGMPREEIESARAAHLFHLMPQDFRERLEAQGRARLVEMGWFGNQSAMMKALMRMQRRLSIGSFSDGRIAVSRAGSSHGADWVLLYKSPRTLAKEAEEFEAAQRARQRQRP